MKRPRPPAGWQAVGAVLAVMACGGAAAGKSTSTPAPIVSWAPVGPTTTQDGPRRPVAPIVEPVPTSTPAATHGQPVVVQPRPVVVAVVPTVAAAKAYALGVLGATQYACLDAIATHESNWNPRDVNTSSGAYGIFQSLPGSKMAVAGTDWRTDPVTQTRWVIRFYIPGRYGSACGAWAFWMGHRWY